MNQLTTIFQGMIMKVLPLLALLTTGIIGYNVAGVGDTTQNKNTNTTTKQGTTQPEIISTCTNGNATAKYSDTITDNAVLFQLIEGKNSAEYKPVIDKIVRKKFNIALKDEMNCGEILFVALPIIILLGFIVLTVNRLEKHNFDIARALSENRQTGVRQKDGTWKLEYHDLPSAARVVMLFAILLSILFLTCLLTFSAYQLVVYGTTPDFSNIWSVISLLGVSILPYGVKVLKEKTSMVDEMLPPPTAANTVLPVINDPLKPA